MQRGKDAAANCALTLGLSRLQQFPGIADILNIRGQIVPYGDPEAMSFFDHFGVVDADTGGAGALEKPYKRHIGEDLAESLGRLAAELGLPASQLAVLALMAAHVDSTIFVVSHEFRVCMRTTLVRFGEAVQRRAERAQGFTQTRSDAAPPAPAYSFDDLLGQLSTSRRKPVDPQN